MTPSDVSLINRAKGGDARAITLLINQHLSRSRLTAYVMVHESVLRIKLVGEQTPDPTISVQFIHRVITNLLPDWLTDVQLSGWRVNNAQPDWLHTFRIASLPAFSGPPRLKAVPSKPQHNRLSDADVVLRIDSALAQFEHSAERSQLSALDIGQGSAPVLTSANRYRNNVAGGKTPKASSFKPVASAQPASEAQAKAPPTPQPPLTDGKYSKLLVGIIATSLVYVVLVSAAVVHQFHTSSTWSDASSTSGLTPDTVDSTGDGSADAASLSTMPPFHQGVTLAQKAVVATTNAHTVDSWQQAADLWQAAAAAMARVPEADPNYAIARNKAADYRRNQQYASQMRLKVKAQ